MKVNYFMFLCVFLIFSCQKDDADLIDDSSLIGKWSETIEAKPQGLIVYDFTLNANSIFILKITHFGTYANQNDQDLSAWTEFSGSFEQNNPNFLILNANKYSWWDDFYDMMTPVTESSNAIVFENCTYKIVNNILELTYTTYPADSPIVTKKEFKRVE